jgi:oligosaccharyltransferase complex subunit epsilon
MPAIKRDIKKDVKKEVKKELKKDSSTSVTQSISDLQSAVLTTYRHYLKSLTPRLKLIDLFLVFLVLLGVLQFVYVLLVGNFPFNAFLGGFISCVGQFVLTVSLRLQINLTTAKILGEKAISDTSSAGTETNALSFSPEISFRDYIFASLILHFVIFHFIN